MPSFVRPFASLAVGGLLARQEFSNMKDASSKPVECNLEQQAEIFALWENQASSASPCDPYVVAFDGSFMMSVPCTASECLKELETVVTKLPNCSVYGGILTEAENVQWILEDCKDGKNNITAVPPQGGSVPTNLCTATQVEETAAAFVAASKIEECKDYTVAWSQFVGILAPCNSTCAAATATSLNASLPDCYYEFDAQNKKQYASDEYLQFCQYSDNKSPDSMPSESDGISSYFNYFRAQSIAGLDDGKDTGTDSDKNAGSDVTKAPGGAASHVDTTVAAIVTMVAVLAVAIA